MGNTKNWYGLGKPQLNAAGLLLFLLYCRLIGSIQGRNGPGHEFPLCNHRFCKDISFTTLGMSGKPSLENG